MSRILSRRTFPGGQTLSLRQGDLTAEPVDAIVNAANDQLQHGGGVARAIALAGGEVIQQESDAWLAAHGPVPHDRPAVTGAGRLPCRYVIHAVGPVWGAGDEDARLAAAVTGSLRTAEDLGLGSIAFPAISTGIYGFPRVRAAGVIFSAIAGYFSGRPESGIVEVRLVLYDAPTLEAFSAAWEQQS